VSLDAVSWAEETAGQEFESALAAAGNCALNRSSFQPLDYVFDERSSCRRSIHGFALDCQSETVNQMMKSAIFLLVVVRPHLYLEAIREDYAAFAAFFGYLNGA
jgi:hypothetical protein